MKITIYTFFNKNDYNLRRNMEIQQQQHIHGTLRIILHVQD